MTITQNLIYEILKINFGNNLNLLEIYESNDEKDAKTSQLFFRKLKFPEAK